MQFVPSPRYVLPLGQLDGMTTVQVPFGAQHPPTQMFGLQVVPEPRHVLLCDWQVNWIRTVHVPLPLQQAPVGGHPPVTHATPSPL